MMISIIIPALNEEKYLPRLLKSIQRQNLKKYEVIVADAGSTDKTVRVAKKYGCTIVPGGLPATGRNAGAKVAKGDFFVFIDADTALPEQFFSKGLREFEEKKLGSASVFLDPQKSPERFFYNILCNYPILLLQVVFPHGSMCFIVKKEVFEKVGGFDETIKLGEDHYFVQQASRCGKFRILRSTKLLVNTRRFQRDGWVKTFLKFALCELHMIFLGPVRSDIFRYRFNHYSEKK